MTCFNITTLIPDRVYENNCEVSASRAHLRLRPITVRQDSWLMDRLINVCYSLSVNPEHPTPPSTLHHTSAFSFITPINNQHWSHYCTYEINLFPVVHNDVITGKSMPPALFSGAGWGLGTSALIIQLLTLLLE